MSQKQAAYDNTGAIVAFYDTTDSPAPEGTTVLDIADEEWQFLIANQGTKYVKDGALADVPPRPADEVKAEQQDMQWTAIKAERDRRTQNGGYFVQAANKWFHSDQFSRTQQIGLVMYGTNMPPGINWKTMDGSFVPMTPQLAQAIFAAAGQNDQTLFAYGEQLHAQVLAADDPMSVDIMSGWPKVFGE